MSFTPLADILTFLVSPEGVGKISLGRVNLVALNGKCDENLLMNL